MKKTSTAMNPPGQLNPMWEKIITMTANARSPSISAMYFFSGILSAGALFCQVGS
jgi:hypothetical protein